MLFAGLIDVGWLELLGYSKRSEWFKGQGNDWLINLNSVHTLHPLPTDKYLTSKISEVPFSGICLTDEMLSPIDTGRGWKEAAVIGVGLESG